MFLFQWVYIGILVIYGIYSSFSIYHALRFGFKGDATRPMTVLYLIVSVILIYFSWGYVFGVADWEGIF